jgi:hypothetical protein
MVFRRLDAELTLNSSPYAAGLRVAAAETRTFSASAVAATRDIDIGFETAGKSARTYSATVAETAKANVAARVKERETLVGLAAEYSAIASAAEKGSARQVAAARLAADANKKAAASILESKAASAQVGDALSGVAGVFERVGLRVQGSSGAIGSSLKGLTADSSAMAVGVGAGVAAGVVALAAFEVASIRTYQHVGGEIRAFQRIAGTSAEDSSKLVYAFHELGIEPETAARSIGLFSRNLVDHADKVEAAGVSIAHLRNGNVDTIGSLYNLADAFQKAGPGAEGTALALDLLGRGGAALIPVLQRGREGLKEFFAEAKAHGRIFSQEDEDSATNLTLATRNLQGAFQGLEVQAGRGLVPALTGVAEGLATVLDDVNRLTAPVGGLGRVIAAAFDTVPGVNALKDHVSESRLQLHGWQGTVENIASRTIPVLGIALDLAGKKTQDHTKQTADQLLAYSAVRDELGQYGVSLADTEDSVDNLTKSHQQEIAEIKRHGTVMVDEANKIGLSESALAAAIGYQGRVGVDAFQAEEKAARDLAAAVDQGVNASSAAFLKTVDAVGHFSASALESAAKSSTKSADTITRDDTRVADALQNVADLQERFADEASKARAAYADKVTQTDQKLADAEASYADTVESNNRRITDSDRKLADDRVSLAQSVVDAERRLEEDRVNGQQSIADAQQRLADIMERKRVAGNPAALKAVDEAIQLRDANAAIARAQDSAADKERSDLDAIAKAKENQIRTLAKDQEEADRVRIEAAKAVDKAEEAVTTARKEQAKVAQEGLTIGQLTLSQQAEMRRAVEAVGKAQTESAKVAATSTAQVSDAISVTTGDVKKFYEDSLAQGRTFSAGIHSAIERGYDPGFISRLLQEGPKEAAPILSAIASDQDNSLRDLVNASEKAISEMNTHIREVARLTNLATHSASDQMNVDFSLAMGILEQNSAEGGRRTASALAEALGVGVGDVERIAKEYGITLADGINPVLAGVGAPEVRYTNSNSIIHHAAIGGQVPGVGDGDIVPAMLTPGEFVFSKAAVQRLGVGQLEELHQQARRGYAEGGFVTTDQVPSPPDLSLYGNMVGYSGSMADKKMYDEVTAFVRAHPPTKHGASGGGGGYGFQALIDYLDQKGIPNEVTSTTGGIHAAGSRHGMGLAADFVSDNMSQIGHAFADIAGSMYELIHNPGFSIKAGREVDPSFWGFDTWSHHANHVHAATFTGPEEGPGIPGGRGGGPPLDRPADGG